MPARGGPARASRSRAWRAAEGRLSREGEGTSHSARLHDKMGVGGRFKNERARSTPKRGAASASRSTPFPSLHAARHEAAAQPRRPPASHRAARPLRRFARRPPLTHQHSAARARPHGVEGQGGRRRRGRQRRRGQGCVRDQRRPLVGGLPALHFSARRNNSCRHPPHSACLRLLLHDAAHHRAPPPAHFSACSITSEFLSQFNREKQSIEQTIEAVMCVRARAAAVRACVACTRRNNQAAAHRWCVNHPVRVCAVLPAVPCRNSTRQINSLMQESQTAFLPEELDSEWPPGGPPPFAPERRAWWYRGDRLRQHAPGHLSRLSPRPSRAACAAWLLQRCLRSWPTASSGRRRTPRRVRGCRA